MIITFGAANLGNIVDIENNKKFERDEGLMFPGFYNGLNELNNDNNGLSSGMCLASMKNNEKVFCPLINLSYIDKKYTINNISFSSPNIFLENRTSLSKKIIKAKNINNNLQFEFYGDKGLSNKISNKKLDVKTDDSNLYPTIDEKSEPINQLYYIDINKKSYGNIPVEEILIENNDLIGIYIRCNTIISKTFKSKHGKINDSNLKYISNLKSFTLNLHISEKK